MNIIVFLRFLTVAIFTVLIIFSVVHWRQNKIKEQIISKALETEEGRKALAEAMVEPIRRSKIK